MSQEQNLKSFRNAAVAQSKTFVYIWAGIKIALTWAYPDQKYNVQYTNYVHIRRVIPIVPSQQMNRIKPDRYI